MQLGSKSVPAMGTRVGRKNVMEAVNYAFTSVGNQGSKQTFVAKHFRIANITVSTILNRSKQIGETTRKNKTKI